MFYLRLFIKQYVLFLLVFVFAACNKSDKEDAVGNEPGNLETKKGFHNSTERPVGKPFVLPAGVTIAGKIKGYSIFETRYCDNKTEKDAQGVGALVRVCVPFYNNNNFSVSITCEQGLVFIARQVPGEIDSLKIQNGILVIQSNFTIPAKTIYYQPLFLCCLNNSRNGSAPTFEYEIGPVTTDKDMLNLFTILNKKKLSNDPMLEAAVQGAVWDVTAGESVSKANLDIINAQPDR